MTTSTVFRTILTTGKRGFTLVELLVVVAMIALITGSVSISMSSAMQRARIQKASAEVATLTQAILAYENHNSSHELATRSTWSKADMTTIGFLLGEGGKSAANADVPVLVQASLTATGEMRDPWGVPYYVMISPGNVESPSVDSISTGYFLPNFYRLTEDERK